MDLFDGLRPTRLYINTEQKEILEKEHYQIVKWENGEKLCVNGKYVSLSKMREAENKD